MNRAIVVRSVVPWTAALMLTACSAGSLNPGGGSGWGVVGPSGGAPVSLETQRACRQRANEIFEKRNRPEIYAANPSVNTPFSANYEPDVPSRGLSSQFAYEQTAAECERNAGTATDRTDALPPAAPGQAAPGSAAPGSAAKVR